MLYVSDFTMVLYIIVYDVHFALIGLQNIVQFLIGCKSPALS